MTSERYAPGHSPAALAFMRVRRGASHAAYFLPFLAPGQRLLDCGCGPGTITVDLAAAVAPGAAVGIDREEEQLARARGLAEEQALSSVTFQQGDVYDLPFEDASFDRVFANALFEHVADPVRAIIELHRVLTPGGVIGLSVPDLGGLVIGPEESGMGEATERYRRLQARGGGDYYRGRTLGRLLREHGFTDVVMGARAEVLEPSLAGPLFAEILEATEPEAAAVARAWARDPDAFFAQTWIEVTGTAVAASTGTPGLGRA